MVDPINFGDLDAEANELRDAIAGLRAEFAGLRRDSVSAGSAGASSLREESSAAKALSSSLGSVTKALQAQFTFRRALRLAIRETKKGFEELISGAVEFGKAQEKATDPNRYESLFKRVGEGFKRALGVGGEGLFSSIKKFLDESGTFVRSDVFGGAIKAIDDGLADAVDKARELIQTLDPQGLLQISAAIGDSISTIASVLAPVVRGVIAGLGDFATVARAVAALFKSISPDLAADLEILTRMVTVLGLMLVPAAALGTAFGGLLVPILLAAAAAAALGAAVSTVGSEAGGAELKFGSIRDIIATDIVFGLEQAKAAFEALIRLLGVVERIKSAVFSGDAGAIPGILKDLNKLANSSHALDGLDDGLRAAHADIIKNNDAADTFAQALSKSFDQAKDKVLEFVGGIKEVPKLVTQAKEEIAPLFKLEASIGGSAGGTGVNPGIGDAITADITKTMNTFQPVFRGLLEPLQEAIADVLDPNRPGKKSLRKRWEEFFKSLPIAILKAFAGTGGGGGGAGFARGGPVGRGVASLAHFARPRGFSEGGPPSGVDPSDNIPIWVQAKEWVIRAHSALMYGRDFMQAVNEGRIDPSAARALVSSTGRSSRAPRGGFATGGPVTSGAGASGSTTNVLPILPVDRQMAELVFSAASEHGIFADTLARHRSVGRALFGGR